MVILTVLIRALHARFGQPVDVIGAGRYCWELLEGQPGVGEVLYLNSRRVPYWINEPKKAIVRALRARGVGPAWWGQSNDANGLELLARAGWTEEWIARAGNFPGLHDPDGGDIAFSDLFFKFAEFDPPALAASGWAQRPVPPHVEPIPELRVSPAMREDVQRWLAGLGLESTPLILVQAGNKRTMRSRLRPHNRPSNTKYWPEAHWAQVLRGLRAQHPKHALLLLGVPNEASLNDSILELAQVDRAYNVAHDLPLRRLMALAERATGMLSVDTGPAHVAAALGCSLVVLFGKAKIDLYCPRGRGARVRALAGRVNGEQDIAGIHPDDVLDAWLAVAGDDCTRERPGALSVGAAAAPVEHA
jgi:ADP-heptose:LPS heptosyltransferase